MKIVLIILATGVLGVVTFLFIQDRDKIIPPASNISEVNWAFEGGKWQSSGNPPACPEPFLMDSPVDLNLVSGILYPGQMRGADFKPHGGFRFDNRDTNDIVVRAIMDGYILKAARYDDGGEIQHFMFYVHPCGLMIMHDHLLTLPPKLQQVFDTLPLNLHGDSRTTFVQQKVYIEKGEILATEIGYKNFEGRKNIFVDFGLYDLRKANGISYDNAFRTKNPNINEYGAYALCWLDYFSEKEKIIVKNLPAGGHEGKVSDYCK